MHCVGVRCGYSIRVHLLNSIAMSLFGSLIGAQGMVAAAIGFYCEL